MSDAGLLQFAMKNMHWLPFNWLRGIGAMLERDDMSEHRYDHYTVTLGDDMGDDKCPVCGSNAIVGRNDEGQLYECGTFVNAFGDVRDFCRHKPKLTFKLPEPRWPRPIPVSERLPERDGFYLAFAPETATFLHGCWEKAEFDCGRWLWGCDPMIVSHWLPLPSLPNQEDGK